MTKILVFCCNWCSYAGADSTGVARIQYSPNVRIIRVMCSGAVDPSLILGAFEYGIDGVMVTGCHVGDCHYISGNEKAEHRIKMTKKILSTLGIGEHRLRLEWISASESEKFALVVNKFASEISELRLDDTKRTHTIEKESISKIMKTTRTFLCISCGKCSGNCVLFYKTGFSPRSVIERTMIYQTSDYQNSEVWNCLTCARCSEHCPSDVRFHEFVKSMRIGNSKYECAHSGILHRFMRLSSKNLNQNRLWWITDNLRISRKNEILYFVGCLPYYDILFSWNLIEIARSTLAILNTSGITPMLLKNERCCGHDLLWSGDTHTFEKLATKNIEIIHKSGAKKIIFSCPECYRTFKYDYPQHEIEKLELFHISEFVAEKLTEGVLSVNKCNKTVTYHDSCRLGRHLKIYDEPRHVLSQICNLIEMPNTKNRSICCGTNSWLNCSSISKELQIDRLKEAKSVANNLITSCPKCLIHFNCAMRNMPIIPIIDFSRFVQDNLCTK
jgi:Fe-S oxidoreductase/coenzyme F420-reducing hydrogenase delta subunit